jgi:hypothetical protein
VAPLAFDRADLAVEVVDQRDRGEHVGAPRVGKVEPREQFAAGRAEEAADRAGVSEAHQRRVHAVLELAAVLDQMQPPARPLACLADLEVW